MHHGPSSPSDAREPSECLRFGAFELDLRAGELRRDGHLVRIQPQPLRVLALLASRPGEVVTREEIQRQVWPAGTFVDFEQSLNFCVRQIRAALGDSAPHPRYLATLPRRGYKWIGGGERISVGPESREWPRAVPVDAVPPPARSGSEEPRIASPAWRRALLPGLVCVAAAAIAVAVWPALRHSVAEPPSFQRLTFRRGNVGSARFGPDGEIVFAASWDGRPSRIYSIHSDPRDVRTLDLEGTVVAVSSGAEVAFLRAGTLARVPLAAGHPKEVLRDVIAADWTSDGGEFAVARAHDGRIRVELPIGRALAQIARPSSMRVSPGARYVAVAEHPAIDDDRGRVVVFDRSGRQVAASETWASLEGIAWSADGREVWFTAASMGADNAAFALALDGRVRRLLAGMGRLVLHDVSADGRLLLERATARSELLYRGEGASVERDLSWFDFSAAVALTADGADVLFYESGEGGGSRYATFLRRTDGSPPVRVASGRACDLSPDGQWSLAIDLPHPDHVDLTSTGPGDAHEIRIPGAVVYEMAGFVGSSRALFVTARDAAGARATWLVNADGSHPRRLSLPQGRGLLANTFSPDGRQFVDPCGGDERPCVQSVDGSPAVPVRGALPGWRAAGWDDRGRLYFRDRSKRMPEELWRVDLASGQAQALAELAPRDLTGAEAIAGAVVARSGEAWAYNVLRRLSELYVVSGVR